VKKSLFKVSKNKSGFLSFMVITIVIPYFLFSHPHVFIDNTVTIIFNQETLAGIKAKWDFDEMYSSTIKQDFDLDKDGKFNSIEIKKIEQDAFSNLRNFNYFTYIVIDGENFEVKYVKDFSAWVDSGIVTYCFFIPCHISTTSLYKEIKISMYDVTYFVDVLLVGENPVCFEDTSQIDLTYRIFEDTTNAYYYGQIYPETIILKFGKKK
jgi:ABC-type uncharacterized transport system substrate-binding protein